VKSYLSPASLGDTPMTGPVSEKYVRVIRGLAISDLPYRWRFRHRLPVVAGGAGQALSLGQNPFPHPLSFSQMGAMPAVLTLRSGCRRVHEPSLPWTIHFANKSAATVITAWSHRQDGEGLLGRWPGLQYRGVDSERTAMCGDCMVL